MREYVSVGKNRVRNVFGEGGGVGGVGVGFWTNLVRMSGRYLMKGLQPNWKWLYDDLLSRTGVSVVPWYKKLGLLCCVRGLDHNEGLHRQHVTLCVIPSDLLNPFVTALCTMVHRRKMGVSREKSGMLSLAWGFNPGFLLSFLLVTWSAEGWAGVVSVTWMFTSGFGVKKFWNCCFAGHILHVGPLFARQSAKETGPVYWHYNWKHTDREHNGGRGGGGGGDTDADTWFIVKATDPWPPPPHTHSLTHTHTHTHTHSLSLSLTHTHTHTRGGGGV